MLRPILRLSALALLLLGGGPALAAPPGPTEWRAVLVAGDNAEPVFDNAVAALTRWLAGQGEPAGDIHRLSAAKRPRDPGVEPASAELILDRIAALRPRPGEGCLVFITSHGQRGAGIWLAYSSEFLRPASLARALSAGCRAAPTVAILSSCYSGSFTDMRAPNRIIVTAARSDRPSFGCQANRTFTVFDECLLTALPQARTWRAVYDSSRGCVRRRERALGVLPSRPQAFFGAAVRGLGVR